MPRFGARVEQLSLNKGQFSLMTAWLRGRVCAVTKITSMTVHERRPKAPLLEATDYAGSHVNLGSLTAHGPLVLVFLRGFV